MGSINSLTETDKAYLAAILDGEGSVGISKVKSTSTLHPYQFNVRVIVVNTDLRLIKWLKKTVGAGCAHEVKRSHKPNWNKVHRYQIVGDQARKLLLQTMPYLLLKKRRAAICLKLPHQGKTGFGRTLEEYATQESLYLQLKKLNRRGVIHPLAT